MRRAYSASVSTDDTVPPDQEAAPEPTPASGSAPVSNPRRDASGPAIAAVAALVLFSVFIGVFGPRVGNRQQSPAGVTLIELAEAVVSRSQPHFSSVRMSRDDELTTEDFERRVDQIMDHAVAVPSLDPLRLAAMTVQRVRLPGGAGGLIVLKGIGKGRSPDTLCSVAMLEDEDRFTVFDRYGRPLAMPEGEVFTIQDQVGSTGGITEVYREGALVFAVHAPNQELAREIVAAWQDAAARRLATRAQEGQDLLPSADESR